jgi:hypothetical protein
VVVEATEKGNEIEMRARGPEHKALLSILSSDLEALNDSFKGLQGKVEKWVPCICDQCRKEVSPEMFDYAQLIRRKRDGKLTIECRKSYVDVSVLELLEGLKLDQLPDWAETPEPKVAPDNDSVPDKPSRRELTVRIFFASSVELKADRDEFELYLRQQNDRFLAEGFYLKIVRWENFLDAMSDTRLQDDYKKAIKACDIFVSLFMTKTGKYTEEEFDVAHAQFKATGKPLIYTFFREAQVSTTSGNREDLKSLWAFQDKLKELGHFFTKYGDVEHLKRQFIDQIYKLRADGRL